jgi:hypothetical protein
MHHLEQGVRATIHFIDLANWPRTLEHASSTMTPVELYRSILSKAEDNSLHLISLSILLPTHPSWPLINGMSGDAQLFENPGIRSPRSMEFLASMVSPSLGSNHLWPMQTSLDTTASHRRMRRMPG